MLYSILQIIAFQVLFLLVYDVFLKRETFFNYNRAYLLITSVLSLVLPFLKFPELKTMATKDMVIHLPEVFIGVKSPTVYDIQIAEQAGIILEQAQTPIWQSIILFGMAIASLVFLTKIGKLYWLKYKNPKRWQGNILIVNLIKSSAAFSFFNTIFLGERIPETEKSTIYEHELVHIKEYHSLDVVFFEVLKIVFWFNPLVYIYQNRTKELHEYIADATAVKQSGKAEYYASLLHHVLDVHQVSFANTFFKQSLIKKRIAMLQKSKSKQQNLIKYALLIPMVFGMLIYTSTEVRAQEKVAIQEQVANQELTDAELIKKYYDEFVAMKKNGATFFEIAEYAVPQSNRMLKYVLSRTEFLKMKAYGQYIADGIDQIKSDEGTLTQKDLDTSDLMSMSKFETYEDFKAFKNTKEEKERWESNTQDGVLKLIVDDFSKMTEKEQKRYDALLKQLESDKYFEKLVVVIDLTSTLIIDSYHSNNEIEIVEDIEVVEVPFSIIDEVATLPECQDLPTNNERKDCMNMVISKHIGKNFNTSIGDSLTPGRKRIFVQFKIDKTGKVKHIVARGPSVELEQEAERVLSTLPQFIPGKQRGELVVMPFSVPIVFEVVGDDNDVPIAKSYEKLVAQRDRILNNSSADNSVVINLNKQIDALKEKLETISDSLYVEQINTLEASATDSEHVSIDEVEVAPIHPDCASVSNKEEQKDCTIRAITMYVGKNINTDLAHALELPAGKKRTFVQFTINKQGNVTNINARGPHPKLEEEAIRVMKLLPQFSPGKHNGESVNVAYSLPIVFQIQDPKKD